MHPDDAMAAGSRGVDMSAFTDHPCLDLVTEAMRRAIEPATEEVRPLSGWLAYHLGWSDIDGAPSQARRGKSLRAGLCLVACQAVNGDPKAAVPAAAAIELTHQFSLIHDDIEDGDRLRRGRPALWTLIGVEQAINAGDALWAMAQRLLLESGASDGPRIEMLRRYQEACRHLTEGQYLDLRFEAQPGVVVGAYLDMAARKTGALFAASAALGALAGGGSSVAVDGLADYGAALGLAFQIADDILGLWSTEVATGKPIAKDLQRGKKTLPILLALENPSVASRLDAYFAAPNRDAERAAELVASMAAAGVRDQAVDVARRWSAKAAQALEGLDLVPQARLLLESLAWQAVVRQS